MTEDEARDAYEMLLFTERHVFEEKIRAAAKIIADRFQAGMFKNSLHLHVPVQVSAGDYVDVTVHLPVGAEGFALQLLIERQIWEQTGRRWWPEVAA